MSSGYTAAEDAMHPMAQLLEEIEDSLKEPKNGEIRSGIIVDKRPTKC